MEDFEDLNKQKHRAPKRLLRVTFPDGKELCYKNATVTFMETLRRIGIEKLQTIDLVCSHIPLIGKEFYPKFKAYQKELGNGWYVMTQSDTDQKFRQLLSIKQQLNLDIKIEMGTDFETDKCKMFQKSKKMSNCLLVKFPDGEYVGGQNPIDTYIEALKKIGFETLLKRNVQIAGKQLITSSKMYNGQVEIESNKWLTIPGLTKEKIKSLRVIGSYMHLDLEITLI